MKENILKVSLEPTNLLVNHSNKLIFRLTNTSDRLCSNIIFYPTFPNQLVSLKGLERLEVSRLDAGESMIYEFLVRPKCIGELVITSRNFSYRDGYGQSRRITDLQFIINVKEMVKEHAKTIGIESTANELIKPAPDRKTPSSKPGFTNLYSVKKILILSSNPKTTPRLRFDEEVREIEEGLKRSQYRWQFQIQSRLAVRLRDLRRALLDIKPQIVHFIGHGKEDGLLVEDEIGNAVRISRKALAGLFQLFSDQVECVILSACYSAPQAAAISKHIHHVIGMCKEIKEKAAIEFAVGIYDALGAGKSVEEAFKFGCNAILVTFPDIPQRLIPVMKMKNKKKSND